VVAADARSARLSATLGRAGISVMRIRNTIDDQIWNAVSLQMNVVGLEWRHIPLKEDDLPNDLPKSSGVYALQGCHDSTPSFGVLYVGQAQVFADRVPRSLCERLFWKQKGRVELYSDIWQASLFVADLKPDLLNCVEAALIAAHAPPFNNIGVRGVSSIVGI